MKPHQRIFDRIREAVLPEFRDRVADYLEDYEHILQSEPTDSAQAYAIAHQLRGYLRGLNTTRVLGMADWEDLDRRVVQSWL
jgi:antirestriction protein ArdC